MPPEWIPNYRLIRQLGAGGMGEVYLATHETLGKQVAIKLLPQSRVGQAESERRFLREAQAAATLDHPNICPVYDYGVHDGRPFIVMQYVAGETLGARLRRSGALGVRQSLEIGLDIAEGLKAAHHHGIVHRDLKPQNVMVSPDGQVKVLDFGLAKVPTPATDVASTVEMSELTSPGALLGTAPYMAPEQVQGRDVDGRADLFALGAVLYECLTGERAFAGQTAAEIYGQILHVDPPPPSSRVDGVPSTVDEVVQRLLSKDPGRRIPSAESLVERLRAELAYMTTRSERRSGLTPFSTRIAGRERPRWMIAAAVLGVALGAVGFWWGAMPRALPEVPAAAQRWFDRGVTALRDGSYLEARRRLEQAVAAFADFPLAHARLAEAHAALDEGDQAKDQLLEVGRLVPNAERLPADVRLQIEGTRAMVLRQADRAVDAYMALAARRPQDAGVQVDLGRAFELGGRNTEAAESYTRAIALDPQLGLAYLRRGSVRGAQGQKDDALADFDEAQRLYQIGSDTEGQAEVWLQRGTLHNRLNDLDLARQALTRAQTFAETADQGQQRLRILSQLSSVAASEGKFDEAERLAREAANQVGPFETLRAISLVDLGVVLYSGQKLAEAEQQFRGAIELATRLRAERTTARARLSLAALLVDLVDGRASEAMDLVRLALPYYQQAGFATETVQGLNILARAYDQQGAFERARATYDEMLTLARRDKDESQAAAALDGQGTVLWRQGQYQAALEAIDQSLAIFAAQGSAINVAYGRVKRLELLTALNRIPEATALSDELDRSIAKQAPGFGGLGPLVAIAAARLDLATNRPRDALRRLTPVVAVADLDTSLKVEAVALLAHAEARQGLVGAALTHAESAMAAARKSGDPVLVSRATAAYEEARAATSVSLPPRGRSPRP